MAKGSQNPSVRAQAGRCGRFIYKSKLSAHTKEEFKEEKKMLKGFRRMRLMKGWEIKDFRIKSQLCCLKHHNQTIQGVIERIQSVQLYFPPKCHKSNISTCAHVLRPHAPKASLPLRNDKLCTSPASEQDAPFSTRVGVMESQGSPLKSFSLECSLWRD